MKVYAIVGLTTDPYEFGGAAKVAVAAVFTNKKDAEKACKEYNRQELKAQKAFFKGEEEPDEEMLSQQVWEVFETDIVDVFNKATLPPIEVNWQ